MREMIQPSLFHEDIWQALTDCVRALGGAKKVGATMRPELDPSDAGRWLLDCLNPARKDKLDLQQIIFLLTEARDIGCHAGMTYLCRVSGYADPSPIEPEDELASLQREFIESNREQQARAARLEALFSRTQARKRS